MLIGVSDTLKKQASQQNAEYNRLADEHNKAVSHVFGGERGKDKDVC